METNEVKETKHKEFQVVKSPSESRQLLHKGHQVKDFKKNRENHDATVFVFSNTEQFRLDWEEIKKNKRLKKISKLKHEN